MTSVLTTRLEFYINVDQMKAKYKIYLPHGWRNIARDLAIKRTFPNEPPTSTSPYLGVENMTKREESHFHFQMIKL